MAKGTCDICVAINGDRSEKEVQYCSCCHRNICNRCRYSADRIKAWWRSEGRSLKNLLDCLGRK